MCGLAWSAAALVAFRLCQGAAGAILSPSVFSITLVTFEEGAERNKALGVLGAIAGSGAAIGVILGGILTEYAGWEWIFFVNVPIGLLALIFVPRVVRESRADGLERHFDAAGAVTVTAGLMLLVYGLTRAPTVGWTSPETILCLVGWAVLSIAFILIEMRSPSPLVPLSFFRRRTVTGANVIGLLLGTAVFGMFFLLSLYMQQVIGFSALETGLRLPRRGADGRRRVRRRAGARDEDRRQAGARDRHGSRSRSGFAYFTQISVDGSYVNDLLPGFILIGIGLGFSFVPVSIAALAGIESPRSGARVRADQHEPADRWRDRARDPDDGGDDADEQPARLGRSSRPEALVGGFSLAFWVGRRRSPSSAC